MFFRLSAEYASPTASFSQKISLLTPSQKIKLNEHMRRSYRDLFVRNDSMTSITAHLVTDAEKCSLVKRLLGDVIDQGEIAMHIDHEDFVNQWNKLQTLQFPHTISLSMPHSDVIGVPQKTWAAVEWDAWE